MSLLEVKERVVATQVWQSVFRHRYLDSNRNRSLAVFSNVFLHVHPVKVRERSIRLRHTMAEPENKLDKSFVLGYVLVDDWIHSRGKED